MLNLGLTSAAVRIPAASYQSLTCIPVSVLDDHVTAISAGFGLSWTVFISRNSPGT